MAKIIIPAEELLCFGGIDYCMAKKKIDSLKNCEVKVSGNLSRLGLLVLGEYLKTNNVKLKSLELSDGSSLYQISGYNVVSENYSRKRYGKDGRILEQINSLQNKQLWASMVNTYSFFSIKGPLFWKNKYDSSKTQLNATESEIFFVKKLEMEFSNNCDAEKNLIYVSKKDTPCDFLMQSQKMIGLMKGITKDNNAKKAGDKEYKVLLYNTQLLHPGTEALFFIQAENGIELLAPKLNLYLFFPDSETHLIIPFFDYLKNNFIKITKEYASFVKGTTVADKVKKREREDESQKITEDKKNLMLARIQAAASPEQIIWNVIKELEEFAINYNLSLSCENKNDSIVFFVREKEITSDSRSFDFSIPRHALLEQYDKMKEMIKSEILKMAV